MADVKIVAGSMVGMQKFREAGWRHVWPSVELATLQVVSRARAERRPGMGPRGGPSGVGHLGSLRGAPLITCNTNSEDKNYI